jgi:hypothetical protein
MSDRLGRLQTAKPSTHLPPLGVQDLRDSSGNLAIFTAILRASSRVKGLVPDTRKSADFPRFHGVSLVIFGARLTCHMRAGSGSQVRVGLNYGRESTTTPEPINVISRLPGAEAKCFHPRPER